jgi:bacterioferritin
MAGRSFSIDVATIRDRDVTTRRLIEDILAEEEEHADDILDLLGSHAGKP